MSGKTGRRKNDCTTNEQLKPMFIEDNIANATGTLSQRFLMLIEALSGIRGLTSIISDQQDEQELLNMTLEVLIQNIDFEGCSIFLLNENDELHCVAGNEQGQTLTEKKRHSHNFRLGEGIIGHAAKERRLIHSKNCKEDKDYLPVLHSQMDQNIGSLICVPVMIGEEVLGVLNISHPSPFFFHPWQEHVFSIYANILAQMLYNHRLVKDMTTLVENRTKELQHSLQETETLKSKYQALSVVDDLTQINNRRYFFTEVPAALARALRQHQPLNLLFIDLDHFKTVNDSYGHEMGDKVLKDVAAVLAGQSRKGDILARIGGEEFALAIPNTDARSIKLLAERINKAVAALQWEHEGQSFSITLSTGISELHFREDNDQSYLNHLNAIVQQLVREADEALYNSKNTGRNKITFHSDLQNTTAATL